MLIDVLFNINFALHSILLSKLRSPIESIINFHCIHPAETERTYSPEKAPRAPSIESTYSPEKVRRAPSIESTYSPEKARRAPAERGNMGVKQLTTFYYAFMTVSKNGT